MLTGKTSSSLDRAKELDVLPVSKEDLLKTSDFISIHLVLGDRYKELIKLKELDMMKKTAFLINTSRGEIINEDDLIIALSTNVIAGAGLDVVEPTPPDPNSALLSQENVIITPHTAFFSQASTLELERRTAAEVVRVLNGETPENLINPDVLGTARSGI